MYTEGKTLFFFFPSYALFQCVCYNEYKVRYYQYLAFLSVFTFILTKQFTYSGQIKRAFLPDGPLNLSFSSLSFDYEDVVRPYKIQDTRIFILRRFQ